MLEDQPRPSRILLGGATVGILDALAAIVLTVVVFHSGTAAGVFRGIASGLLGPTAATGGTRTAVLGAALHFFIAFAWTTIYFIAYGRWPALRRLVHAKHSTVLVGISYGVLVWAAMRFIVLPLSLARAGPVFSATTAMLVLIHMLFVGLPIVLIVRGSEERDAPRVLTGVRSTVESLP
jgi:hypothetical protein